jgi:hypothetical protein
MNIQDITTKIYAEAFSISMKKTIIQSLKIGVQLIEIQLGKVI